MLVLSRRPGEALRIGTELRVRVISISGRHVRLGIEAPDHVSVHREEVFESIARANREAAREPESLEPLLALPGPVDGGECGET